MQKTKILLYEQQQRNQLQERKNFLLTKINHVLPSSTALKKCTSQYTLSEKFTYTDQYRGLK